MYTSAKNLRSQVEEGLTQAGYFRSNPLSASRSVLAGVIIAFVLVYFAGKHLGLPLILGLVVGGIIAFITAGKMAARTAKGVVAFEHAQGLKLFLNVTQKDRLAMMQSPNAPYAATGQEPARTVELFEKLLPYAMVLGVEREWAKQFEGLYTAAPSWFAGNWNSFSTYYLISNLSDGMSSAVNTAFSAPSNSGSSGFGGGGFSGGGGGGGGGGGW